MLILVKLMALHKWVWVRADQVIIFKTKWAKPLLEAHSNDLGQTRLVSRARVWPTHAAAPRMLKRCTEIVKVPENMKISKIKHKKVKDQKIWTKNQYFLTVSFITWECLSSFLSKTYQTRISKINYFKYSTIIPNN